MKESDYLDVANLIRVRCAASALRDCTRLDSELVIEMRKARDALLEIETILGESLRRRKKVNE